MEARTRRTRMWMRMSGRADADKDRETDNLYSEPVIPIRVLRSSSFTFSSFFFIRVPVPGDTFPFFAVNKQHRN